MRDDEIVLCHTTEEPASEVLLVIFTRVQQASSDLILDVLALGTMNLVSEIC